MPVEMKFGVSLSLCEDEQPYNLSQNILYFQCSKTEAAEKADLCKAWGGKVIEGERKIAGYGTACIIADPDGQQIGLFSEKDAID